MAFMRVCAIAVLCITLCAVRVQCSGRHALQTDATLPAYDSAKLYIKFAPAATSQVTKSQVTGAPAGAFGITGTTTTLGPCTMRTLHTHKATELLFPFSGSLVSGQIYDNQTFQITLVHPRNATIYPPLVPHFQYNPTCKNVSFIASFNSDPAGVGTVNFMANNTPTALAQPYRDIMRKAIDAASKGTFADAEMVMNNGCMKMCGYKG
eukprot:jgi/Chrzof1/15109/Cz09g27140.t1